MKELPSPSLAALLTSLSNRKAPWGGGKPVRLQAWVVPGKKRLCLPGGHTALPIRKA